MRDAFEKLQGKKVRVYGVSLSSVEDQREFAEELGLPFELISDVEGEICERLGVPRKLGKFASRRAFLFRKGKLVWRDDEGTTAGQGAQVLEVVEGYSAED